MVDHVLDRQARMGNGVPGNEDRMARTRGDQEDSQMTDAFRTNGTEGSKTRMGTGRTLPLNVDHILTLPTVTPAPKDEHGDVSTIGLSHKGCF
jgi:hypothetical protein